jgi:hypothetical protein
MSKAQEDPHRRKSPYNLERFRNLASRRALRYLISVFILPAWVLTSLIGVVGGMWFLTRLSATEKSLTESTTYSTDVPYQLFAALPKKGQVLSQRIDSGDGRILKVKAFLKFYRSPMEVAAEDFVRVADTYKIPWTLLPAIACKESGCGRVIPHGSYNAFGWAIYSGQNSGAVFTSWADAIDRVGKGLRRDYFDQGLDTVAEIEMRYTPSSARTHNGWQDGVNFFMDELENWEKRT